MALTIEVRLPDLGEESKDTVTLVNQWYAGEGCAVRSGDDLAELVTDKAAFCLPAPASGVLVRIIAPEGSRVKAGDLLAVIAGSNT
ncbi:MAG: lipoyl domain-containing protein [Planctomycetota bacterium]|nr:lipoyl domain-containing protein [Planctomycetota bacterium]